jgi:sec-independent protein translocase protein TatB
MFEVGFPELVLIAIVGLLVIGPDKLPETLRTLGLWLGRMRRSFTSVKAEIEKEIGMDEVRRQLHNEAIMEEMKRIEQEVKSTADTARNTLNEGVEAADTPVPSIDPGTHADIADTIAAQDDMTTAADTRSHADAADDVSDTEASEPREASTPTDSAAAETPSEAEDNRADTPDPLPERLKSG